jgi:hypothetical protein
MRNHPFGPWATALSPLTGAKLSSFWVRRLTTLARLGQSLPTLTRRARYGLIATAMIALVMPSLRGTHGERSGGDDDDRRRSQSAIPAKSGDQALDEFLQIYRLDPGQDVKRIEPPRPAGVNEWWKQKYPNHGNRPGQFGSMMVFRWRDPDHLENWGMGGYTVRSLPRFIEMGIYPPEIEGDAEILKTDLAGDWVFREGVPDERMVRSLEPILQRALRMRIKLAFRQVERDVAVARGRYHHSPLPQRPENLIEIYGKELVDDKRGGGTGSFPMFLKWVSADIDRPIVNEVKDPPKEQISWYDNMPTPYPDGDKALVLYHLQQQTGLSFTREKRPIRVLYVERPK